MYFPEFSLFHRVWNNSGGRGNPSPRADVPLIFAFCYKKYRKNENNGLEIHIYVLEAFLARFTDINGVDIIMYQI